MHKGKKLCLGCNYTEAWIVHTHRTATNNVFQECNRCMVIDLPQNPDVYFKEPYWDFNLHDLDDPYYDKTKGTYVRSKKHKAYLLKKLNLREAGDRSEINAFDPKLWEKNKHLFIR